LLEPPSVMHCTENRARSLHDNVQEEHTNAQQLIPIRDLSIIIYMEFSTPLANPSANKIEINSIRHQQSLLSY
jgi:hypothetical protein